MTRAGDNRALVEEGFAAYDAGDIDKVIAMWHPNLVYHGFDFAGERQEFRGRDAFFGFLMEAGSKLAVNKNEILSVDPVGDEIVVIKALATRRLPDDDEEVQFDYVMVLRIENGQVTHGTDMVDSKFEAFWRGVSATSGA
jgi:ketosteroid isomerase-like protein